MDLDEKLLYVVDSGFPLVNLVYQGVSYAKRVHLSNILRDQDIMVHASDVIPRRPSSNLSLPNVLPAFHIDSIALHKYPPFKPRPTEKPVFQTDVDERKPSPLAVKKAIGKFKKGPVRFTPSLLIYLNREQHIESLGNDLQCTCLVCHNKNC